MVRAHAYRGKLLTVTYEPSRCIHAAECVKNLPEVFDTRVKPWVDPDGARPEMVREAVRRCPSGALKILGEIETEDRTAEIRVQADGPLVCKGRLRLVDEDGNPLRHEYRMTLCRCGVSQNKPFCDNRHAAVRFKDAGNVRGEAKLAEVDTKVGRLDLTPVQDCHLLVEGPLFIRDDSGRVRYAGNETHLCRCGASKDKPFCDGSHINVGFRG